MSYDYNSEKKWVFTEKGQVDFLKVRDFCAKAFKLAGAVRANEAMCASDAGDSWSKMACVDRLVELGELREIPTPLGWCWQDRVFVNGKSR